eukprot:TRINITY_DN41641_c0_g1_i1.p1 TRINITY_DN41641_c0_g1~~TRINITY_DN41641_c0_g1_i1.p1  ORF type:complete len:557 (+),score=102.27 TRINITY_DN41641_c0_g1_i1:167-1837(+)
MATVSVLMQSLLIASMCFSEVMAGVFFTNNPVCVKNACVNPITPGLNDMPRLEKLVWQCSAPGAVQTYLNFCKEAIPYDPALPSPAKATIGIDKLVRAQDDAASTMFYYHLSGIGYDAWKYKNINQTQDPCVLEVWKMVCYTYFPKNQAGCKPGAQSAYFRPCKSECVNYMKQCNVECCDDSARCVFHYTSQQGGGVSNKISGYVNADAPSAICTGVAASSSLRAGTPLKLLMFLFGIHLLFADSTPSESKEVAARSKSGSGSNMKWLLIAVFALCSVSLQGCSLTVPSHRTPNWLKQPDYLVKYEYVPPGQPATAATLNSCAASLASGVLQCSGRGICEQWSNQHLILQGNTTVAPGVAFCVCEPAWADPECRTLRKSQLKAWSLSVLAGFLGADQFYLGYTWTGLFKLVTLGGGGAWWIYDIVRIGASPVYAGDFLVQNDLPHWVFLLCSFVIFGAAGFIYSLESYMTFRKEKRQQVMKMHQGEEDRVLENLEEMDGPRFKARGGTPNFMHSSLDSQNLMGPPEGYGSTMRQPPASLGRVPSAGAPLVHGRYRP